MSYLADQVHEMLSHLKSIMINLVQKVICLKVTPINRCLLLTLLISQDFGIHSITYHQMELDLTDAFSCTYLW